jgi:hypothetical protein
MTLELGDLWPCEANMTSTIPSVLLITIAVYVTIFDAVARRVSW